MFWRTKKERATSKSELKLYWQFGLQSCSALNSLQYKPRTEIEGHTLELEERKIKTASQVKGGDRNPAGEERSETIKTTHPFIEGENSDLQQLYVMLRRMTVASRDDVSKQDAKYRRDYFPEPKHISCFSQVRCENWYFSVTVTSPQKTSCRQTESAGAQIDMK